MRPPLAPPAAPRAAAAFTRARPATRAPMAARRVMAMASSMQFIKGIDEPTIPDVKLTRSRDGSSGTGALRGCALLSGTSPPAGEVEAAQCSICACMGRVDICA